MFKREKLVMICSGCLLALCSPLSCSYVQGKFNTVDYLPTVFEDSHLCVSRCANTCNLGVVITVGYIKSWAGVCLGLCENLAKENKNRLHIPYLYFRSCRSNIQRTCNILEVYFFPPSLSLLSLTAIYTHAKSVFLFSRTHAHPVQAGSKQCRGDNYLWCQTGL